ncbi:MAG TPA: hypothetical protein VHJ38_11480 [Nitrososphaeraceae archaeon]|nr:hypothetical protein [Nitrososphaeraceae archaeon]
MSIKNDLYSVLNDLGKESLQIEFQSNINSSVPKIKEIISKTIELRYKNKDKEMLYNDNYNDSEKSLSLLCESLLHFLLTITSLPSQRKIMLKDVEIDLVIPDLKSLNKGPKKSLIIKFDKDASTINYIDRLHNNIPIDRENVWIISPTPLDINSRNRNYVIYKNKKDEESHILFTDNKKMDENSNYFIEKKNVNINNTNIQNANSNVLPFFNIIADIDKFLKDIKHTGFKFVP